MATPPKVGTIVEGVESAAGITQFLTYNIRRRYEICRLYSNTRDRRESSSGRIKINIIKRKPKTEWSVEMNEFEKNILGMVSDKILQS